MFPWLLPGIAVVVVLVAAATDLRNGRIPNALTIPALLLGLVGSGLQRGAAGALAALAGLIICAVVPGIVYKASQGRGIGGGDIKLFAALGALLGPAQGLEVELSAFLILGLFAMFRLAFLGQLGRTLVRSLRVTVGLFVPRICPNPADADVEMTSMRLGPAIAVAVLTVLSIPQILRWFPWLG